MKYRCEATSLEGFVQQLASNILPHGYWHNVTGRVPDGKDPHGDSQIAMGTVSCWAEINAAR